MVEPFTSTSEKEEEGGGVVERGISPPHFGRQLAAEERESGEKEEERGKWDLWRPPTDQGEGRRRVASSSLLTRFLLLLLPIVLL